MAIYQSLADRQLVNSESHELGYVYCIQGFSDYIEHKDGSLPDDRILEEILTAPFYWLQHDDDNDDYDESIIRRPRAYAFVEYSIVDDTISIITQTNISNSVAINKNNNIFIRICRGFKQLICISDN